MTAPCLSSAGTCTFPFNFRILPKPSSSGQTKKTSATSEAESYLRLAQTSGLLPQSHEEPFHRVTTEDDALDSFQNLLFSIARFHEYTGRYPSRITVVGYEFKRRRFTELHRAALRWPEDRFRYIGIDAVGEDVAAAQIGEVSAISAFALTLCRKVLMEFFGR